MTIDIAADRAIIDAATAGLWAYRMGEIVQLSDGGNGYPLDYYPDCETVLGNDRDGDMSISDADCEFIAAARQGWPAALDECERLRVLLAEACRIGTDWKRIAEIQKEGGAQDVECMCAEKRREFVDYVKGFRTRVGCLTCDTWDSSPRIATEGGVT